MSQPDYILLGEISGVSGLKGWVKVFSHTNPRIQITEYSQWYLKRKSEDWSPVKLLDGRAQGKNIVVLLDGVSSRNQAEAMIGTKIAIRSDQLQKLEKDEFCWKDLIGISVETTKGFQLGKLDWIFNSGSNDVLIVKDKDAGEIQERMIPFLLDDVVISIDLDKALMVVDWDPEF